MLSVSGLRVGGPGRRESRRRAHAQRGVRPALVVVLTPVDDEDLGFGQAGEPLDVEQLVADPAVEGLHERVLPGRAGLDDTTATCFSPGVSPSSPMIVGG